MSNDIGDRMLPIRGMTSEKVAGCCCVAPETIILVGVMKLALCHSVTLKTQPVTSKSRVANCPGLLETVLLLILKFHVSGDPSVLGKQSLSYQFSCPPLPSTDYSQKHFTDGHDHLSLSVLSMSVMPPVPKPLVNAGWHSNGGDKPVLKAEHFVPKVLIITQLTE